MAKLKVEIDAKEIIEGIAADLNPITKGVADIIKRLSAIDKNNKDMLIQLEQLRQNQSGGAPVIPEPEPEPIEVLAFPGAKGFGRFASGGRGGRVIKVTNLNDSGAGSLRQAVQYTTGARIVVFEVGGTISLESILVVKGDNVTIAGQTAPGGGILLKNETLSIECSNVIVRHIRSRFGLNVTEIGDDDSLGVTAWGGKVAENIVFDHCSISWGPDGNFDIRSIGSGIARNITMQNCIISENTKSTLLYAVGTYNVSYIQNLLANCQERNIRTNFPPEDKLAFEMINNIIHGWRWATNPSTGTKFSVINNKYTKSDEVEVASSAIGGTTSGGISNTFSHAYIEGNTVESGIALGTFWDPYKKNKPFASSGFVPLPAEDLDIILDDVGASKPMRDSVDARIVQQYRDRTGSLVRIGQNPPYPTIANGTPPLDSNNDGIPDDWTNANMPSGVIHSDVAPNGYTYIENYVNELAE